MRRVTVGLLSFAAPLLLLSAYPGPAAAERTDAMDLAVGLRVGGNIPTNAYGASPRGSLGVRLGIPLTDLGGPYAGARIGAWGLAGEGEIDSGQIAGGPVPYTVSGAAIAPQLEAGWRFETGSPARPWVGAAWGTNFYSVSVETFDNTDSASGTSFALDVMAGLDWSFDFGGALQAIVGHTYTEGTTPEATPLLGRANMGGLFVGLGYSHQVATF